MVTTAAGERAAAKDARWARQRLQRRQAAYGSAPGARERFEAAADWLRAAKPGEAVLDEAAAYLLALAQAADAATAAPPPPRGEGAPAERPQGAGMGRREGAQARAHARVTR